MARLVPSSRLALKWRRWRDRQSIAAPRLVVRPQPTRRQRLGLAIAAAAAISAACGMGAWLALYSRNGDEAVACQALAEENQRLASRLSAGESHLQIERAAQEKLAQENARLTAEIARLREELSVFRRLSGDNASATRGPAPAAGAGGRPKSVP